MLIKSFRLRLAIFYTIIISLMISAFAFALYREYLSEVYKAFDDNLIKDAKAELIAENKTSTIRQNAEMIKKYSNEFYQVINSEGKFIIASADNEKYRWPLNRDTMQIALKGTPKFETIKHKGENYRLLYYPIDSENILRIGESLYDTEQKILILNRLSKMYFPLIFLFSALISWLFAWKAISPVIKIRSLAEQIRTGGVEKRIEIRTKGSEIDDLVKIFNEMLESIQTFIESQKRFTSDVSHEIRSPLTSLRGNIEVALRKKRHAEEYEAVLQNSLSDILRLSKIVDNLLFLSRADNNTLELRMQRFDIPQLLRNITEQKRNMAISHGLSISEEYQEHLELFGDMDLLEQAFSNIIDNAIKYTPSGGKITIKAMNVDNNPTIIVSDTGVGISQEEIPHIFERFYRADKSRSGKSRGTGLGLSITKWIINAHNGKIFVKSKAGSGSDFVIVFPQKKIKNS